MAGREKKNVLIVDDDSSVRKSISRVLKDAGYEVSQARDEQEAMTQFDSKQIDLVLLDLGLPNRSGWDMFEGFTSRNPTLPIIITGNADTSAMPRAAFCMGTPFHNTSDCAADAPLKLNVASPLNP